MMLRIGSRHPTLGGRFGVAGVLACPFHVALKIMFSGGSMLTLGARKHD